MRYRIISGLILWGMAGALLPAAGSTPPPDPIRSEIASWPEACRLRVLLPYDGGVAGYFVERYEPDRARFVRLNASAVPSPAPGGEAAWIDLPITPAGPDAVFRLVGRSISGAESAGCPFTPEPSVAAPGRDAAGPDRLPPSGAASPCSISIPGARVKVAVEREGMRLVSAAAISACLAGSSEAEILNRITAGALRMRRGTNEVAWCASPDGTGVCFYAEAINSIYTRWNVYWIERAPGLTMEERAVAGVGPVHGATFRERLHFEQDQRFSFNNVIFTHAEDDIWFWAYIRPPLPDSAALVVDVPDPVPGDAPAQLTVHMKGSTELASAPEHHARVYLNGALLGSADWAHLANCDPVFTATNLVDGTNTVLIEGFKNPGEPEYTSFIVDSIDLDYTRACAASSNALAFTGGTNSAVTVTGFDSTNVWLFDVSDPARPVRLVGARVDADTSGAGRVSLAPEAGTNRYVALAAFVGPDGMAGRAEPTLDLATNGADYVVIAPAGLACAAEAWAEYRRGEGWVSRVVDIEDVYDAFSGGVVTPWAIRSLISRATTAWERPPRYVVLAGAGTTDYRDVNGLWATDPCLIPPVTAVTPYGLYGADTPLADADGDHVPDVALGRLPVVSTNELLALLEKTRAYEAAVTNHPIVEVMADNLDASEGIDFPSSSDSLTFWIPSAYSREFNYLSTQGVAQVRARLFAALDGGCALATYVGHANDTILAGEGILRAADVGGFTNATRAPVLLAMTCLFGRFDRPSSTGGLAENLLRRAGGGLSAVWSCTSLSQNDDNTRVGEWMMRALFRRPGVRLGAAARLALASYAASPSFQPFVVDTYTLLGDPLLNMHVEDGTPATFAEWSGAAFTPEQQADPAVSGAGADPDGDGAPNAAEFAARTRPLDGGSRLAITSADLPGGAERSIRWSSESNCVYSLECAVGMGQAFEPAARCVWGTPPDNCVTDRVDRGVGPVIYRVRLDE